jgi:hypothetical protein
MRKRFLAASPRMKAFAVFKVVPGLVGIPLVIIGAATGHDVLLIVGFVFLGVYVTEMAVVTPVLLARGSLREPNEDEEPEDAD